jgi:restriction endonuclease S subunit
MTTLDFHHHHIGGAQPLMTQDIIGDFTVSIPPLSVQKLIVHVLKFLDDKIEANRRINDNLEQQAQALFKSWFVDFEPFKDGEFVESGSQRAWHRVMIVRFDSFRFGNGSNSYSLNGTVQLDFDED